MLADVHGFKKQDYYTFANLREPVLDARGKQVLKNKKKIIIDVLVGTRRQCKFMTTHTWLIMMGRSPETVGP